MSIRTLTEHFLTIAQLCLGIVSLVGMSALQAASNDTITVADASLSAAFYSDSSCLLTVDSLAQSGKTVIDADVDDVGSRVLIHCDTDSGRRLTLLARGDSLNVSQRVPLLTREQIQEGEFGMIVWLTRSGVHYADDSAPRRYVIAGSVMLRKSPPVDVAGGALHNQRQSFARLTGVLEPISKTDDRPIANVAEQTTVSEDQNSSSEDDSTSASNTPAAEEEQGTTGDDAQSQNNQ